MINFRKDSLREKNKNSPLDYLSRFHREIKIAYTIFSVNQF